MVTNQPQAPQIMDPDTAYATVHNRVYAPVFFEKLANDYGIRPKTQQDAVRMLTMAGQLRQAHDAAEKQAAAKRDPLAAAEAHLNKKLEKMGFAVPKANAINPNRVKQAAAQASFDPELASAILSMEAVANGVTAEHLAATAQHPTA